MYSIASMLPTTLAFVDIETSGTSLTHDSIIEIGILRVENEKIVKKFQSLIQPQTFVSPFIQEMTGITTSMLEKAPSFSEVRKEVFALLQDAVFVAHNARFDYGFLRNHFKRHELSFSAKQLCTVKLSRHLFPRWPRHNLDSVIEHFDLTCKKRHRAYDDAKVLWDFYKKLLQQEEPEKIEKAIHFAMKRPSLPLGISEDSLDDLPETSGVYLFYGEEENPLYIGKSKNIRDRVLSHFSGDLVSGVEMKITQQIKRIETIPTAGELGALLLESSLIKQLQPLYNRMLRYKQKLLVLKQTELNGYSSVILQTVDHIDINELDTILGVFKSQKQAKNILSTLAKAKQLCPKLLGLEKTKKSCFAYQLEQCKGACIGKERPLFYNTRFLEAFSHQKFKTWPFKGPIRIKEKNLLTEKEEVFVIDKWCLLGSMKDEGELSTDYELQATNYLFDVDTYKILSRFLLSNDNTAHVTNLPNMPIGMI